METIAANAALKKIFLSQHFEKEEKWLADMALKGLMLSGVNKRGVFTEYRFRKCAPKRYFFLTDLALPREINTEFFDAYAKAGYSFICRKNVEYGISRLYFVSENDIQRPQTDEFTKINYFDKLYKKWGSVMLLAFSVYAFCLYTVFGAFSNKALFGFTAFSVLLNAAVFFGLFCLCAYCVLGLFVARNKCIKRSLNK